MPGVSIDGNDLFAVFSASAAAVGRARAGHGPSLIECRTYRLGFHNTSDNPNDYRDPTEVTAALEDDPIGRIEDYVLGNQLLSAAGLTALKEQIARELLAVQQRVANLPSPGRDFIFDHVFATPTVRLEQQRLEQQRDLETREMG